MDCSAEAGTWLLDVLTASAELRRDVALRQLVLECAQQQVCARCVLRLFGHPASSDVFGITQTMPSAQQLQDALGDAQAGSGAPPATADATQQDGNCQPQTKRVCVRATSSAVPLPAHIACPMCLGILQLLDGSVSCVPPPQAPAATIALDGASVLPCDPAAAAAAVQELRTPVPLPSAQPATLAAQVTPLGINFQSFGVEITVPAVVAAREHAFHAHLVAKFGSAVPGLVAKPEAITKLKAVAQRMLRAPLAAALNAQHLDAQQADLSLQLDFDHQASYDEHVALAQDCYQARQQRSQSRYNRGGRGWRGRGGGGGRGRRGEAAHGSADADDTGITADGAEGGPETATTAADGLQQQQQQQQQEASELQAAALEGFNLERTQEHLGRMQAADKAKLLRWPPLTGAATPTPPCCVSLRLHRAPLLVAGRYLKTRRNVPQTCWMDLSTGRRIGDVSLAERIEALLLPLYSGSDTKFMSGGREDADVRMLGEGRPFVMEVLQPQRGHPSSQALRGLEAALAAAPHGVQVRGLQPCTRDALERLKEAEETKEKTYQALCWCSRPLDDAGVAALMGVQKRAVAQDTPVRVLHRRASKIREKWVTVEEVQVLDGRPHYFTLKLRTQAGTYVKEFCHGDWGRTVPSVGDILGGGVRCEILQLDVLAVHMEDWP